MNDSEPTPDLPDVLDAVMAVLQKLFIDGTAKERERHPRRRPTWAPAIAFRDELIDALRPYFNDCECRWGRLWAYLSWDRGKWFDTELPVRTFSLRAGALPNALGIVTIQKKFKGGWRVNEASPKSSEPRHLGVEELVKFSQSPEEVMKAGARESGLCYVCNKHLTDPQSMKHGIGPECFKNVQIDESLL
jgi:hypothetical protein